MFKEAKSAYRERKAEIVASRQHDLEEKMMRRALKAQKHHEDRSVASSRKSSRSGHPSKRPTAERHHTTPLSPRSFTFDADGNPPPRKELVRRHTDRESEFTPPPTPTRALTTPAAVEEIDLDLAYGDIPPPLPVATIDEEAEFKSLVNKVKKLLEEADCLQHTAAVTIANLKKNPDAMAAIALTLAEISNLATKMAPGAVFALKGSAPAVFALLTCPQFLIGGGVAVGLTVVAFGGYKVVKKIKANRSAKEDPGMDEMLDISGEVNRIDNWRRGIAEVEAQSVGTSVDGEFITPHAAALSRLNLDENGLPPIAKDGERKRKKSRKASDSKSVSSKDSKSSDKSKKDKKERREKKEKKPSQLRLMFTGQSA